MADQNLSGTPPMTTTSYTELAKDLRHFASVIDSNAPCLTIYQERALSQALKNLSGAVKKASVRHASRPKRNQVSAA